MKHKPMTNTLADGEVSPELAYGLGRASVDRGPTAQEQVLEAMIKEWLLFARDSITGKASVGPPYSEIDYKALQPAFEAIMGRKAGE